MPDLPAIKSCLCHRINSCFAVTSGNGVVQHIKVLSLEEVRLRLDRRQTAIIRTGLRRWFLRNLLKTADCLRHSKFKA